MLVLRSLIKTGKHFKNKQNSINDYIAAIDFLVAAGYSKNEKIATHGYSNGGLTMGAVLNQAPEKVGVSVPGAGFYDMVKRDHLSISIEEFGTSDNPDQFKYLYAYSPYHNVKDETEYPPALVMASEHDDRVFPFHSYKFVARLQEAQASENPILLHLSSGGHSFTTKDERVKELADMISFILWNMGIEKLDLYS